MRLFRSIALAALGASLLAAAPASAESQIARGVAFFERISLGDLDLAPANIFYDERCADPLFCFHRDTVVISLVLFTDEGLREVVLKLGERTRIPGGHLTLTSVGTPPSRNGAISLEKYQLELVYVPLPKREGR